MNAESICATVRPLFVDRGKAVVSGLIGRAKSGQWRTAAVAIALFAAVAPPFGLVQPAIGQTAESPKLSPELRKFADECEVLGRGTVLKIEETMRGLRSGQVKSKNSAAAIKRCQADIAEIKSRDRVIVPSMHYPVTVGVIGRLPDVGAHIEQILGPDEMLVKCSFRVQVVVTRHYRPESEVVRQPVRFKVRGLPTKDFSEGSDAELLQVFRVGSAQTYRTTEGKSASVLVLEPFDMQPIENYLKAKPAF
jgi:hypothetical protein